MNTKKIPFDRNKPYNQLPELPPKKNLLDHDVLFKWGMASRQLAELKSNILRLPNPYMLINTISLQEAKTSNAIENIFTTEDELYVAISNQIQEEQASPAAKEVLRYREALWEGYLSVTEAKAFNTQVIIRIFQKVKNTTEGIRPPQSQIVIKRGDSEFRSGEIVYTPPRGAGVVEQKLENLLNYMNSDPTDPLIKMIVSHYQFEAIHPFRDGNGRTGRIMNLLYLSQQNLLSHPVLYISGYILRHKDEYYKLLAGVSQRNDWKNWLIFMLEAVEFTSNYTNQLINRIVDQMQATYNYAMQHLRWYNHDLNLALFSQPYIKQDLVQRIINVNSRTTLVKYMQQLTKLGILTESRRGREVFYINKDLIQILES